MRKMTLVLLGLACVAALTLNGLGQESANQSVAGEVIAMVKPQAQTWSPEQQEIWRLEDQQWKMGAAKDLTWIDTMVHPNISFWDVDFPAPQNKASLSRWAKYSSANSTVLEQEIFPISVTITGNVAVAQYRYRVASENYKKERETVTGRWTDVFIKEGGRWLFIAWAGGDDPKKQ